MVILSALQNLEHAAHHQAATAHPLRPVGGVVGRQHSVSYRNRKLFFFSPLFSSKLGESSVKMFSPGSLSIGRIGETTEKQCLSSEWQLSREEEEEEDEEQNKEEGEGREVFLCCFLPDGGESDVASKSMR